MRLFFIATVFVGLMFIGIAATKTSAQGQGQSGQAGITNGETLTVAADANGPGTPCKVIEVRGDFVGCEPTAASRGIEHWYNLRLIGRVDRPSKSR